MKNFFSRASSGNKKSAGDSIIASQNLSGSTSNTSAAVASNPNSNAQNLQNQNLNHVNQSSSSHSMPNANPLTTPTDLNTNTGSITGVRRNSRPPAIVTENLESSNQDEIQQQVQVQPQHSTSNSIIDVDSGNLIISMNSNMSSTVGNLNQSLVNLQSSGTGAQNHNGIQQQNQNQNDLIVAQQQQSQVQVNRSAEAKILETNSPAHVRIGASPIMNIQNLNANLAAVGGLSMSALTQHRESSSLSPKDDEVCENQQHHVNHMNQIGRSQQTQSQNQNQSSNVQHGNQNPSTVISSQQNNLGNNLNLNQSYDQNHTINSQTQTVVGNTATQNYNSNSSSNTATITPVTQSRLRNLTGTLSDKATSFKSKFLGIGNSSLNVLQQIQSHNPTANLSNNNQSHLNNLNNNNNQNSSNRTSSQAHSGPTSPGNISMTKYKLQDKLITSTTVQKTQNLTENGSGSPASQKHEEDQHPTLLKTECDSDLIKDNITSASPRSTVQVTNQQSEFGPDSIGSVTSGVDNNDSSVAKTSMTTFNKFRFNKSKSRQEVLSIVLWPLMSFLDMVDAVNLSMCCKEFYQNRRIAHLSLQPNLLSRNEFERWLPNQRYCGVLSLCLTNILLDLKNFKDLRVLKITLEISRKLRRSVYPHISSDCLLPYLNLNNLTDLSLDSLTVVPNLSDAVSLRHLFLAFRKEGTVRFNCGSKKLISVQLASCNGGTNGHSSAMDFPQLPASDVLAVLENLEEPKKLEHLRLRRIRITENVRALCHFVSHHCAQSSAGEGSGIKMFTFTTLPLSLNFQDFLQLRVKLGLIAFSARCNGAAASETWPSFWPNMSYFWPRGIEYITPFTVFSTDFAFDELHISAEEEWRKLSSEEMERYEDICSEVKRVYELTHPPVQSKWHQRLQMLSQSCNPLRMLTSGLENRRNERRNQRLQRQAREVQDAQNNAGEVANQPRSSAISQVYSLVTSPLNLIRSRNGPTALNTNSGTANTTPLLNPNGTASGSSNNERNQNQNGTANGETPGSNRSITRDNVNGATSTSTANNTDATRNLSLADNSLNTPPPVQRSLSISSPIRSMPSLSLTGISNSMPRPNNLMSSFGNVLRRGNTGNNGNMNQQQNGGTDRNNGNASANNNNNQSILNESGGRDHGSPVLRSRSPTRLRESHYDWTLHNQHLNNEHNLNLAISNYTREVQSLRQNIQNQTDQFQNMMNNSQNQNGNQSNQLQSPIQLEPPLSPTHNIDSPQAQRMTANHSLGLFRPNFDVQGSTNLETANQLINPDANTLTGTSLDSDNNNMNTLQNQNIASSDANINDPDMLNMNPITGPIISSQYARSLNSPSDAEGPTPSSSPILRRDLSSYNSWDQGPMSPDNHTVAHDWNNMSMTLTPYNSNPVLLGSTTVPMNIATDVNDAFSSNNMAQCQNADSGSASSSSSVTGGGTGVSSAVNGTNIVDIGSSNVRGNSSPTNGGASANTRFQNEAQNRVLQQAAQQQALLESSMNRALCNYLETALKTGALRSTGIVRSLQDKFLLNRSGNYYDDDITGNSGSYNDFNNVSLTGGGPGLMPFGNMNNNLGMFGSGTALNQNRLSNRNPNFSEGQLALDGLMRSLGSELQSVGAQYQCQGLSMTNRQGTMSGYNGNNINDMGNFNSLNDMNNISSGLSQYQDADRLLLQNELNRGQHANGPLRQSQTNPGSPTSSSRGLNSSDIAAARLYRDRMIMLDSYLQAMNISESGIANNGGNVLNSSNLSPTTSVTERDRDVHNLLSSRHLTGTSAMQARQYRRRSLQGLQQSLQSRTDSPVSLSREFLDEAELILLGLLREGRERRRARRLLIHGDRTNRRSNSNTHNRNSSDSDGGNLSTRLNDGVSTVPTRTGSTSNTNIHQTSRSLPSSPLGLMSQNYLRMHQGDLTNLPGLDPMSSDSTNNNMIHSSVANGNGNNAGTGGNNLNLSSGTSTINVNTNYLAVDGPITSSMASTTFASSVATTATNYSIDIYPRSEPGSSCSVSPNDNYLVPQQKLNNTKEDLLAYPLARLTGVDSDDNQGIRLASSTQTVSTRVNAMSSTGSNNHCPKNPTNDPTFMNYSGSDGTSYTDAENSSKGSK